VAKAGVVALSESLLCELQPKGVQVNVVCPSFFQTNLLSSFRGPSSESKEDIAKLLDSSPISATEIADLIYRESTAGTFMILPHEKGREAWAIKQAQPQLIYDEMTRLAVKKMSAGGN
ncbi:MAG: SDR family oxidoreductase, partial [Pseudomonas sp.]